MLDLAVLAQDDGLTLREIIAGIPIDGPAFIVYAILAASLYLIWRGSRRKKRM